jgi:hypothetical protein
VTHPVHRSAPPYHQRGDDATGHDTVSIGECAQDLRAARIGDLPQHRHGGGSIPGDRRDRRHPLRHRLGVVALESGQLRQFPGQRGGIPQGLPSGSIGHARLIPVPCLQGRHPPFLPGRLTVRLALGPEFHVAADRVGNPPGTPEPNGDPVDRNRRGIGGERGCHRSGEFGQAIQGLERSLETEKGGHVGGARGQQFLVKGRRAGELPLALEVEGPVHGGLLSGDRTRQGQGHDRQPTPKSGHPAHGARRPPDKRRK